MDEAREVGSGGRLGALEPGGAAELGEVVGGQIGPPVQGVLANVPENVGQLERETERVRVLGRTFGMKRPRSVPNTPSESRPMAPATQRQ